MSRVIIAIMGAMIVTALAGTAGADTGKWCFQWNISYDDQDTVTGHDTYWLDDDGVHAPARYTRVAVKRFGDINYLYYYLDEDGCTPTVTIYPLQLYLFKQYTLAQKSNREVRVMPDGEDWESAVVDVCSWSEVSPSTIPSSILLDPPLLNNERRLMPAITTLMYQSSLLGWDDGTTHRVSTWGTGDIAPYDPGQSPDPCGSHADEVSSGVYNICISNHWSQSRFNIGHEFGHTITWMDDGPRDGDYDGSEGYFRATGDDNRCNCDEIGDYSHCPTSREFTGSGQKEGFSHFIGAAAYNAENYYTVPANGAGVFFFYKDLMEASPDHWDYGSFDTIFEDPDYDSPDNESNHPYPTTVNTSSNVKWMEWECYPSSRTHYGNEWDWLDFYWNLWTYGSYKFTVEQMQNVWDNVPDSDIAFECCMMGMTSCQPRNMMYLCGTGANSGYPYQYTVGKLWEADDDYDVTYGVLEKANAVYGASMGTNFEDRGYAAGVDH